MPHEEMLAKEPNSTGRSKADVSVEKRQTADTNGCQIRSNLYRCITAFPLPDDRRLKPDITGR